MTRTTGTAELFITSADRPTVVGAGLVALDVVVRGADRVASQVWAGGTCGNVLAILSYLGWRAYPVARLNGDAASKLVRDDLRRWGVLLDFAGSAPSSRTPVFVHRIRRDGQGLPYHTFSRHCLECDAPLPGYRAPVAHAAREVTSRLGAPRVFFLDRVSRGAIIMAQASASRGALVVFEPSGVGDPRLFREALALAHIVKYSHERRANMEELLAERAGELALEIETRGAEGLRYRSALPSCPSASWEHVTGYRVPGVRDAAGAGDWCTAGIVHAIGRGGAAELPRLTATRVTDAMRLGQALAAWNCRFEGARAGMYALDRSEVEAEVGHILSGGGAELGQPRDIPGTAEKPFRLICSECGNAGGARVSAPAAVAAGTRGGDAMGRGRLNALLG